MKRVLVLFALCGLLWVSSELSAQVMETEDVIFDGGPPDGGSGLRICDIGFRASADDFITSDERPITSAEFWVVDAGHDWDGTLNYVIFQDSGGEPGPTVYQGIGQSTTWTIDPSVNTIYLGYKYTFSFEEPLTLNANSVYWLAINLSGGGTIWTTQAFWASTHTAMLNHARISGDLLHWTVYHGFNLAFRLLGSGLFDLSINISPDRLNPYSRGVVPVVVFGSDEFNVSDIDVTTLRFGPNDASTKHDLADPFDYTEHIEDVNLDGFMDLMLHFETQETGIVCGDTEATLSGSLLDGMPFEVTDTFETVGCNSNRPRRGMSNRETERIQHQQLRLNSEDQQHPDDLVEEQKVD